jgi:MFS family permease
VLSLGVGAPLAGRMLDRFGSRLVILCGLLLTAIGLMLLSAPALHLGIFVTAEILIGLGLSSLLGAPFRYIILNEARPEERAAAQSLTQIPASVGQVIGATVVGAIAASMGNGAVGYKEAYLFVGIMMAAMFLFAFGLKGRAAEQATAAAGIAAKAAPTD